MTVCREGVMGEEVRSKTRVSEEELRVRKSVSLLKMVERTQEVNDDRYAMLENGRGVFFRALVSCLLSLVSCLLSLASCLLPLVLVSVAGLQVVPRWALLSCAVFLEVLEKSAASLRLVNQRIDHDHGYAGHGNAPLSPAAKRCGKSSRPPDDCRIMSLGRQALSIITPSHLPTLGSPAFTGPCWV
jgi:hypothetical protein